jgi:hypothetical protein
MNRFAFLRRVALVSLPYLRSFGVWVVRGIFVVFPRWFWFAVVVDSFRRGRRAVGRHVRRNLHLTCTAVAVLGMVYFKNSFFFLYMLAICIVIYGIKMMFRPYRRGRRR